MSGAATGTEGGVVSTSIARSVHLLDRAIEYVWRHPLLYGTLVLATIYAGIWGFRDFYGPQFERTPAWAWPFIPDSPLSTLMWLAASVWIKVGWDLRDDPVGRALTWLNHLAMVWNAKVGAWTVFVLLYRYDHFFGAGGQQAAIQWLLVFTHLGMIALALTIFRKTRPIGTVGMVALIVVVLAWDFVDYALVPLFLPESGLALYPNGVPSDRGPLRVIAAVTVMLSVVTLYLSQAGLRWRGAPIDRDDP